MGFLDFLKRTPTTKQVDPKLFGFTSAITAPEMTSEEYLTAYRSWVYACVNAIADDVASINLIFEQNVRGEWVQAKNNLVTDLLKNVNSFDTFSDLIVSTQSYLELEGNAFWYLPKGQTTKKPAEIWSLNPVRVEVVKSRDDVVGSYVYISQTSERVPIPAEEIIHFKRFNPKSRYRGIGTVQAAAIAIDIDTFSGQFNRNFFYNAAVPSAVLQTEGELTDEQFQRIKAEWQSRYTGTQNAHKLAILQGGLKYEPIALTQRDMQFLEQRKFSRDEILAIFRVPKSIIGITEDVNRANAEASDVIFAKRVIRPKMRFITDRLNENLLPLFGLDDNVWRFRFTDPVPEDQDRKIKAQTASLQLGSAWRTPNEVRAEEGLPPISNGDSLLIPFNAVELGSTPSTKGTKDSVKKAAQERLTSLTGERRDFILDQIKIRQAEFTEIIDRIIDQVVDRILTSGIKSVKKSKVDDLIRLIYRTDDGDKLLITSAVEETLRTTLLRGAEDTISTINEEIGEGLYTYDQTSEVARAWIRQNGLASGTFINDTVKDHMKELISEGVKDGVPATDIAKLISQMHDIPSNRAERIARNEVIKGYQQGSFEAARSTGTFTSKEWITVGDDRVDESCIANENQGVIPFTDAFYSGAQAPPDHPNCRCSLRYLTDEGFVSLSFKKVDLHLDKELERRRKELEALAESKLGEAGSKADELIKQAIGKADKILADSIKSAEAEKSRILDDLVKLRDKALEAEYEQK